jgi:transposase
MKYSKENLENAVKSVKDGVYSYRKASQVFGVPKTTIIDQVSGRIELTSKPVIPPICY